jgi:hypothetical protein
MRTFDDHEDPTLLRVYGDFMEMPGLRLTTRQAQIKGECDTKVIHLSAQAEPEIYETTRRFGTILEKVGFDSETARLDLDDSLLTENTRAAYPITHISNATRDGVGGHPSNIIMLTCDASVSCRRSAGSRPSGRCTISSPATRRRLPAPSAA